MAQQAYSLSHRNHWGPTSEELIPIVPKEVPDTKSPLVNHLPGSKDHGSKDHVPGSPSSLRSVMSLCLPSQREARAGGKMIKDRSLLEVLLPAKGGEMEDGLPTLYRCKGCGAMILL